MISIGTRAVCAAALVSAGLWSFPAAAIGPDWTRQFGTYNADGAFAVAAGPSGRVHVAGYTNGWMYGAKGSYDAFVVTYNASGAELWRRQPGTSENDYAWGIATDRNSNVYVVGETNGSLAGPNKGLIDAFVIKFDRDGRYGWKLQFGTPENDHFRAVAADASGNVYVGLETEQPNLDSFLIKIGPDGRIVWKRPGGARGIATDAAGNVYAVGAVSGQYADASVIKFDGDGAILWKRQPSTPKNDEALGVATDADGNAYVVGYTSGSLAGTFQGYADGFIIKFSPDGHFVWKHQIGLKGLDVLQAVATDANSNVYATGYTKLGSLGGPAQGSYDVFVIAYDRDGNELWRDQRGTPTADVAHGIASDADGNAYVAGYTLGSLGGPSLGSYDAFLMKYGAGGSN